LAANAPLQPLHADLLRAWPVKRRAFLKNAPCGEKESSIQRDAFNLD